MKPLQEFFAGIKHDGLQEMTASTEVIEKP